MNDTSSTTATLDQADEEILTTTVSDETLEAAAGTERGGNFLHPTLSSTFNYCCLLLKGAMPMDDPSTTTHCPN
jgi:hypothetical protein